MFNHQINIGNMWSRCVSLTLLFLLIGTSTFAQSDEDADRALQDEKSIETHIQKARRELSNRRWDRAIFHYQIAYELDSNNLYNSFELGLAYYNSPFHQLECIKPFKRALRLQKEDTLGTPYYYLAKTYHLLGEYENAQINYEAFKKLLVQGFFRYIDLIEVMGDWAIKESIEIYIKKLDTEIAKCKYGMQLGEPKDKNWRAVNLGDKVNSSYPDYAAVFSPDETKLIYTSRREGTKGGRKHSDGIPFEDIYVSDIIDSVTWSNPVHIEESDMFKGISINTKKNESMIGFDSGGNRAYIMRKNDIMYTEFKDTVWTKPKKLKDGEINTRAFEPSMYLYPDGAIFYFSSDRKGGYGGLDIYRSYKMEGGTWSIPVNLGPTINTEFDEDSPFFSGEGNTLYFSSKGHQNIGGFDIFKSQEIDKKWTTPENLGRPFNSPASDVFFQIDEEEVFAYFSSSRLEGYGDMDLYSVMLKYPRENSPVRIYARGNAGNDVSNLEIAYLNLDTTEQPIVVNLENGTATTRLHTKSHYKMIVKNGEYVAQSQLFYVPPQYSAYENYQEIDLVYSQMEEYEGATKQKANFRSAFMNLKDSISKQGGDTMPEHLTESYAQYTAKLKPTDNNKFQEYTHLAYHGLEQASETKELEQASTSVKTDERDLAEAKDPELKVVRLAQEIKDSLAIAAGETISTYEPPVLYFGFDQSTLDENGKKDLVAFAKHLIANDNLKIEVQGNTDSKGAAQYNFQLSKRRAQAAIAFLIKEHVAVGRFLWKYQGEENPVATNDTDEGRKLNRSVRFTLSD